MVSEQVQKVCVGAPPFTICGFPHILVWALIQCKILITNASEKFKQIESEKYLFIEKALATYTS